MIPRVAQNDDTAVSHEGPALGERSLMRAVLEDAIRCIAGEGGPRRERAQLAAQARDWMCTVDPAWPFSFDNICDALGFEVEGLRARLLRDAPPVPADADDAPTVRPRRTLPAEHEIVCMIRAGHPLRVVAETFGISISKASILSCGLASRLKAERDQEIRQLRRAGWTHRALARHFQLSRIRIMRICARERRGGIDASRSAA